MYACAPEDGLPTLTASILDRGWRLVPVEFSDDRIGLGRFQCQPLESLRFGVRFPRIAGLPLGGLAAGGRIARGRRATS